MVCACDEAKARTKMNVEGKKEEEDQKRYGWILLRMI